MLCWNAVCVHSTWSAHVREHVIGVVYVSLNSVVNYLSGCAELTKEFLMIYDKSPSRLQKKITEPVRGQVGTRTYILYTFFIVRDCSYALTVAGYM